jgi:Sel1 repeat
MAAEASSGTNQQLTLDHFSFEKLLAAAWVLQCLHDHLHNGQVVRDEMIAEPVKAQTRVVNASLVLPLAMKPVVQFSPRATEGVIKPEVLSSRPADDQALVELVPAQPAVESGNLKVDAAVKVPLKAVELEKIFHSETVAAVHAGEPPLPVFERQANDRDKHRAGRRVAFRFPTARLQTAFRSAFDTFTRLRPALRVNFNLRALRTVAIATPLLLLALVAASLLLETWRHESFNSAQAISRASAPSADVGVRDTSTIGTATTRAASEHPKKSDKEPHRFRPVPPLEGSHMHVTDPATLSVVQQLSPYEISGLRRQAKYGDTSAAFTLGMAYEVGRHVHQSCAQATRWVTTAAEAGNPAAQYNLGLRYRNGDGVSADRTESEKWLRKAAARRSRQAKLALKTLASR